MQLISHVFIIFGFYDQQVEAMQPIRNELSNTAGEIYETRKKFDEYISKNTALKNSLIEASGNVYNPLIFEKIPTVFSSAAAPTKSGYLYKKASPRMAMRNIWGRRYFILSSHKLSYYTRDSEEPFETIDIDLRLCSVKEGSEDSNERRFTFELKSPVK